MFSREKKNSVSSRVQHFTAFNILPRVVCHTVQQVFFGASVEVPSTYCIGQLFTLFSILSRVTFCSSVAVPSIHCIGHSLGGHICGFTGKELKKRGAAFKIRQGEGDDHHDLSTVYFYFLAFCSFRYVLSSHGTIL